MSAVILIFMLLVTFATAKVMEYVNSGVMKEKLILHKNSRFAFEMIGYGNDKVLFMTIKEPITSKDDFSVRITATRYDGVVFPIPDNPIKLCKLLSDEATNANEPVTQFHMSRVFNMEGATCPIPTSTKRLMPYMFPPRLRLHNDIGCGTFTYETTIQSCQGQKPQDCIPFITASTDVFLSGDHCSNTSM